MFLIENNPGQNVNSTILIQGRANGVFKGLEWTFRMFKVTIYNSFFFWNGKKSYLISQHQVWSKWQRTDSTKTLILLNRRESNCFFNLFMSNYNSAKVKITQISGTKLLASGDIVTNQFQNGKTFHLWQAMESQR